MVAPGQNYSRVHEDHCLLAFHHPQALYLPLRHLEGHLAPGSPALLASLQHFQRVFAVDAEEIPSAAVHCGCAPVSIISHRPHQLALVDVGFEEIALEGPQVGQLLIGADFFEHIAYLRTEPDLVFEDVEGEQPDGDD